VDFVRIAAHPSLLFQKGEESGLADGGCLGGEEAKEKLERAK
jgi:hypothetical protein